MKNSKTLFTIIGVVAALAIGFLIGISIDFPKINNNQISGTIGKVSNYRNVKVTEADIQLRTELLTNEEMKTGYLNYYSFHYNIAAELTNALDFAVKISDMIDEFKSSNQQVISGLKNYRKNIDQSRNDLLLAVFTLHNLTEENEGAIGSVLNNANLAITQLSYNDNVVTRFTEESGIFIKGKSGKLITELMKAHDKLIMIQVTKAVVTKDKPMLKYYDKTEMFSNTGGLGASSNENLKALLYADSENLKGLYNSNQMNSAQITNAAGLFSTSNVYGVHNQLNTNLSNISQLNADILLSSNQQIGNAIQSNQLVGGYATVLNFATLENVVGNASLVNNAAFANAASLNAINAYYSSGNLEGNFK
jgi:hypothetical protein